MEQETDFQESETMIAGSIVKEGHKQDCDSCPVIPFTQ